MKLNNKGYLVIEIILAFMLTMTIVYFFFSLVIKLNNKNQDLYKETVLLNDKATVTNVIETDLSKYLLTDYKVSDNKSVTLELKDANKIPKYKQIKISIESSKVTLEYGPCNDGQNLNNCEINTNSDEYYSKTFDDHIDYNSSDPIKTESDDTISINLPLKVKTLNKDYGIKLSIKKDSELEDNSLDNETGTTPDNDEIFEFNEPRCHSQSLNSGTYKLEVWGAQGEADTIYYDGSTKTVSGGKGGYSKGVLKLSELTDVQVCVGGQNGFNGGGSGQNTSGKGGGATDIRLINESLYSRVIVAGGGGGSNASPSYGTGYWNSTGGIGGGSIGGAPTGDNNGYKVRTYGTSGTFGNGGVGAKSSATGYAGGGGGGWYGGAGGNAVNVVVVTQPTGGYGGTGWVYTEENYNTWKKTNRNDANEYELNYEFYLTDTEILAGNKKFKSPTEEYETGHSGDGYARITKLDE